MLVGVVLHLLHMEIKQVAGKNLKRILSPYNIRIGEVM